VIIFTVMSILLSRKGRKFIDVHVLYAYFITEDVWVFTVPIVMTRQLPVLYLQSLSAQY